MLRGNRNRPVITCFAASNRNDATALSVRFETCCSRVDPYFEIWIPFNEGPQEYRNVPVLEGRPLGESGVKVRISGRHKFRCANFIDELLIIGTLVEPKKLFHLSQVPTEGLNPYGKAWQSEVRARRQVVCNEGD